MLLIDNDVVQKVLTIEDCIGVQEEAFRGLLTGDCVHRPRIDVYVPCDREDGYYRWGSMEGASKSLGVFAIRMKSDIVYWPRDEEGRWTEEKYCVRPVADAPSAVRGADIVATCTDSMVPVLRGDWLAPGSHVTNVGPEELGLGRELPTEWFLQGIRD